MRQGEHPGAARCLREVLDSQGATISTSTLPVTSSCNLAIRNGQAQCRNNVIATRKGVPKILSATEARVKAGGSKQTWSSLKHLQSHKRNVEKLSICFAM